MIEKIYDYHLVVLGDPKAQGRPRACAFGKHARMYERQQDTTAKTALAIIVQQQAPPEPLSGPLCVDVHLFFGRPKNHFGTGRNAAKLKETAPIWHTSRPDRDNLDKLVLDALSGVFWRDDAQVCAGEIIKQYSERPRTEIFIKRLRPCGKSISIKLSQTPQCPNLEPGWPQERRSGVKRT